MRTRSLGFFIASLFALTSASGCVTDDDLEHAGTDIFGALGHALGCAFATIDGPETTGELGARGVRIDASCVGPCALSTPIAVGTSLDVAFSGVPNELLVVSSNPAVLRAELGHVVPENDCSDATL